MLYSDIDNIDTIYTKFFGCSKTDYIKKQREKLIAEKEKFDKEIPVLCSEWQKKGREILEKKYWDLWDQIVPIRLSDVYQGMELGACLSIIKILNNGNFEEAELEIDNQNHSGMSFSLVCAMVEAFCERGEDFVKFIKR